MIPFFALFWLSSTTALNTSIFQCPQKFTSPFSIPQVQENSSTPTSEENSGTNVKPISNPMKLSQILFTNENSGDFSGAGTFQGGPFGFGNKHQLAAHEPWEGLKDQEETDEIFLKERSPSDILYRDLPGFPRMNTLAKPVDHIPHSPSDEERYNVPDLIPPGRDGEAGEHFGFGPLEEDPAVLAHHTDWIKKETESEHAGYTSSEIATNSVPTHGGSMGVIAKPIKHTPGPVDIYKKGSGPGYSLGESLLLSNLLF